jgi:thioredoxin reductase (NADPH)
MEHLPHLTFKYNVVPTKLTKLSDNDDNKGRIQVEFSDGTSDIYDTVLTAIGRTADTQQLGIQELGIEINPNNSKIIGLPYEQSSIPHIYAVGDVLDVRITNTKKDFSRANNRCHFKIRKYERYKR